MTGSTIARIHWRALDREGDDTCRLARHDKGWMLLGHARFRDGGGRAALDYVVRCDGDWMTTSADVTGRYGEAEIALRLERRGEGWTLNGASQPQLEGCWDVDFGFTPATNLMPIRRLPQVGALQCRAAWVQVPQDKVAPLAQTYRRERGGYVHYSAEENGFETHLEVDRDGFVTLYPGLWKAKAGA